MAAVRIDGLEDTLRLFDKQPANAKSIAQQAMKDGAKAGAKYLRRALPGRWRALPKAKAGIDARNEIWCRFGMYNNKVFQGHQPKAYQGADAKTGVYDWFKFYWQNYGTLTRRDRSHKFVKPIKPNKIRRNEVGQPHTNVYDRAVGAAMNEFEEAFYASIERNKNELLNR